MNAPPGELDLRELLTPEDFEAAARGKEEVNLVGFAGLEHLLFHQLGSPVVGESAVHLEPDDEAVDDAAGSGADERKLCGCEVCRCWKYLCMG